MADSKSKKDIDITGPAAETEAHAIEVKVDSMMEVKHGPQAEKREAAPKPTPKPQESILKINDANVSQVSPEMIAASIPDDAKEAPKTDTPAAGETIAPQDESDPAVTATPEAETESSAEAPKQTLITRIRHIFARWWGNKRARYSTLGVLLLLLVVAAVLPPSRSFALNTVGVRGSASITILDATTNLPLKSATVSIGGASGQTDAKGEVNLTKVKLGSQQLVVKKVAFADSTKSVSIGFGRVDLGQVSLRAVGAQYKFSVTDYLSGKPVAGAQAASGDDATALADKKGAIVLTANSSGKADLTVSITADGYRTATVKVAVGSTQVTAVPLVTELKDIYISKQSGKYDVYKVDVDGQHKKLLLAATGNETSNNTLVPNANGAVVALVNNRDNTKNDSGYTLQTLSLINVSTGAATVIDHSERIQIVDWVGDRLVYVAIKAGASAANPSRYLLMSYDYKNNQRLQLDHANAFNDVLIADGAIYYATSNGYNGGVSQFTKINPDNSGKQALLVSEVWNVFRIDYSNFYLATGDASYTYKLGTAKPATTKDTYNGGASRLYIDSPDGKHSLYVDDRDGKGTLIAYDTTSKKETVVKQVAGLQYPVRWLGNDVIIYRIQTSKETADYAVSISGGEAKKITDVTNTPGVALWYYY